MDFIFFFYGASFFVLGAVCFALLKRPQEPAGQLPWLWLGLFGFIHGLNEWLDMAALVVGDADLFKGVRFATLLSSFCCLLVFAHLGSIAVSGRRLPASWFGLLTLGVLAGAWFGWSGANAAVRYAFGFSSTLGAAAVLYGYRGTPEKPVHSFSAGCLRSAAAAMALYGVLSGLIVAPARFFPARFLNTDVFLDAIGVPVQFFRGVLAFVIASAVAFFAVRESLRLFFDRGEERAPRFLIGVAVVLSLMVCFFAAAYRVIDVAGRRVASEERHARHLKVRTLAQLLSLTTDRVRGIQAMADNPALGTVLGASGALSEAERDMLSEQADRYRKALGVDVCYILDRSGMIVVSSDKEEARASAGRNFSFRPYFQKAIGGTPFVYLAQGVTSSERGLYVAFPVRPDPAAADAAPSAVVVAKESLEDLETAFARHPFAFLVSPEGVIFASSNPKWLFRSIRDLSWWQKESLRDSRQLGQGPWDNMGFEEFDASAQTVLYLNSRLAFAEEPVRDLSGWRIVLAESNSQVATVRFFLILIFLVFFLLACIAILFVFRMYLDTLRISATEALYEVLVEKTPDGVELYDAGGRCLSVNKASLEMRGCGRRDVVGKTFIDLWPSPGGPGAGEVMAHLAAGRYQDFEATLSRPDGTGMVKWVHVMPLMDARGGMKFFIIHCRDISEERDSRERLAQTSKMTTVAALATGVAHEFNNVLEIILGNAEYAHASADNETMRKALRIIIDSARRASWISKTILDFSGKTSTVRESTDLADLIKQGLLLVQKLFEASAISVETHLGPVPRVECNQGQLTQAFVNIMVNARDAMRGLPERKLTITLECDLASGLVKASFRDTGTGMQEAVKQKIFGPFVTTKGILGGGQEQQHGMGLGLFVAYGIVKQHGGDITFESQLGKGTTFTVTLPIFSPKATEGA